MANVMAALSNISSESRAAHFRPAF